MATTGATTPTSNTVPNDSTATVGSPISGAPTGSTPVGSSTSGSGNGFGIGVGAGLVGGAIIPAIINPPTTTATPTATDTPTPTVTDASTPTVTDASTPTNVIPLPNVGIPGGSGTTGVSTGAGAAAGAVAAAVGSPNTNTGTKVATDKTKPTSTATYIKGTQIVDPFKIDPIPVVSYAPTPINPQSLAEIQNAANGGIIHKADGGEIPLPYGQIRMRGKPNEHANLFGMRGPQLTGVPHLNVGGSIPEGHNPQFFSEGGLNSLHVRGAGDGTSDSVPAMLANGEFVIPADVVSSLGNGSNDSGAKVLKEFLSTVRSHKQKHDAKHLPPDSKGALGYLLEAKQKVRA